jgi:hypothetical protein
MYTLVIIVPVILQLAARFTTMTGINSLYTVKYYCLRHYRVTAESKHRATKLRNNHISPLVSSSRLARVTRAVCCRGRHLYLSNCRIHLIHRADETA